ncbi:biotin transporter BioY [Ornithinimicrobium cryptoxanthini]|uniref:Biotin transporter n=1 Tax=Ornithinimicrobium cryptoxanthini TaxID=2934161 RepID=A0ABY4YHL4_9MICO|nr:biotin transporter BioY [Ornithinimicrobium cryptoxanthini]USQ76237.1 biotin transporter BioY [Ornithinimicrobium cryptoxanthini]
MTLSLAVGRPTLADHVVPRGLVTDIALVAGGAALTGLLAQVAIPLWPVPITGQTLAVLLVGSTLGASRGALAMLAYAVAGVAGIPWFSDTGHGIGVLLGSSGGYIVGFVLAAALTGWLAQRQWDRKFLHAAVTFLAGSGVVFLVGLPWLAVVTGADLQQTLAWGLWPFVPGGIVKALIAAAIIPAVWQGVRRLDAAKGRDLS